MIRADDAPALESALHREFHRHRVNRINERKEYFRVPIEKIVEAVKQHHDADLEITLIPEARDYRQTIALVETESEQSISELQEVESAVEA